MDTQVLVNDIYTSLRKINNKTSYGNEYVNEKVKSIPGKVLLSFWKNAENPEVKEQLEILIAKKLVSYNPILQYNDVPSIYLEYLNLVNSIDAIIELLDSLNEKIYSIAYEKYKIFFEECLAKKEKSKVTEFRRIK